MSGSGRGGNNNRRRPYRRRDQESDNWQEGQSRQGKKTTENPRFDKKRGIIFERPKWIPPKLASEPLPTPNCPWCGKPIQDITAAITDKDSGMPVHFDCVIARISEGEMLEKGDAVTYIGGGRFGIVHFDGQDSRLRSDAPNFKIKKILEWENKENRAEWRSTISDHYSIT